jgi:hypothetical protein
MAARISLNPDPSTAAAEGVRVERGINREKKR